MDGNLNKHLSCVHIKTVLIDTFALSTKSVWLFTIIKKLAMSIWDVKYWNLISSFSEILQKTWKTSHSFNLRKCIKGYLKELWAKVVLIIFIIIFLKIKLIFELGRVCRKIWILFSKDVLCLLRFLIFSLLRSVIKFV